MNSKRIGELVAETVIGSSDAIGAIGDSIVEWCDAVARMDVHEIGGVEIVNGPIEADTWIELKAARRMVSEGSGERHGRFYLREGQHEHLLDENGVYLLTVYDVADVDALYADPELEVWALGHLALSASEIEAVRSEWYGAPGDRDPYLQIRWSRLPFNGPIEVETDDDPIVTVG